MKRNKHTTALSLTLLASGFLFSGCYAFVQSKIPMNINPSGTLVNLLVQPEAITSLPAPSQIFVSQGLYPGKISVSWQEVTGATSYRIERAVIKPKEDGSFETKTMDDGSLVLKYPEETDWKVIRESYYGDTDFTDIILSNPSAANEEYNYHFYYRITAENIAEGLSGEATNPVCKQEIYNSSTQETSTLEVFDSSLEGLGYLYPAPKNLDATKGKSQDTITLTWNAVPDTKYYRIYRDTREDFTSAVYIDQVLGNITSYSSSVTSSDQGIEFYYKIKAVNTDGQESALCSQAMGYALKAGAPLTPGNVKVINGYASAEKQFQIAWDSVPGEEGSTVSYSLYRTSSVDSVYSLVKKGITATKWVDKSSIKPGIYYYYYVQSVKTDNITKEISKSAFSEKSDEAMGFLLSAPASISVEDSKTSGKVNLVWSPAIGTNLSIKYSYNIYYADEQDGAYNLLMNNVDGEAYENGNLCAEVETKNFYTISTEKDDKESEKSNAAAPAPDSPENVNASKCKKLEGDVFVPNKNEVYPVEITWDAPASGAYAYNIYRSTKTEGPWRKLNEAPVLHTRYIDSNDTAKSGIFYYYKVISLNSLEQGKNGNDPALDDPNLGTGRKRESWGYGAVTREQWFREYNKEIATSQAKLTLMHKSSDLDKVGSETIRAYLPVNGKTGTLSYKAAVAGLGAEITMPYTEYADHTIMSNGKLIGLAFILNGNTDTTSNMSANGNMHEKVQCYHYDDFIYNGDINDSVNKSVYKPGDNGFCLFQGMYPGYAIYDNLQIKSGAAGGGYYLVETYELDHKSATTGTVILPEAKVDWLVGEEIRK